MNKLPRINFHSILLEDQGAPRFQSNFEFAARIFPPTNDALLIVVLEKNSQGCKVSLAKAEKIWGFLRKKLGKFAHILENMFNFSGKY